jgi:hypothetical protein
MASTSEHNVVAGIYVTTDGCHERVTMPRGHVFPPCPKCGKATGYQLVDATKQ